MEIKFSRPAKRKAKLYRIPKTKIVKVLEEKKLNQWISLLFILVK